MHDSRELFLMISRHVIFLKDSHVALHVKNTLIWCYLWLVYRGHAGLRPQHMLNNLFFVAAGADPLRGPVHHVLIDAAHIEALVFAPSTCLRLRLIGVFKTIDWLAVVCVTRKVSWGCLLLRVAETKISGTHIHVKMLQTIIYFLVFSSIF